MKPSLSRGYVYIVFSDVSGCGVPYYGTYTAKTSTAVIAIVTSSLRREDGELIILKS